MLLLAALHLVERRLGDIDMAALDELRHLPIEECQKQRADMRSVYVSICIVSSYPAEATDEIFIPFDGEIVHVTGCRWHLVNRNDRQRHQIAVETLEGAILDVYRSI